MSNLESEDDSVSSKISDSEDDTEITEEERLKIREEISSLSFEELLKMKEQMGAKIYNEKVFGVSHTKLPRQNFKRANKNRPREMSSKIKPKELRKTHNTQNKKMPKKTVPRDPRFDPLCGQFDSQTFKDNYKFVNDIQVKEKSQLEKELKNCKDPERKKTLTLLVQRLGNKIREREKVDKEKEKVIQEKKEIKEKLKKGEKPVFKKKSVKKLENLIDKYEDLKKNNKLQKHIEKRSKKLAIKDRKKLEDQQLLL